MLLNWPLTYKLYRDLWHRRAVLLALIINLAVGVGGYIGMMNLYLSLDSARAQYYQKYHLADFTIDATRAPSVELTRLEQDNPNQILRFRARVHMDGMATIPGRDNVFPIPATVFSVPVPARDMVNNMMLYRERWFSDAQAREAIIDEQFAEAQHLSVGDRLTVRLPAKAYDLLIVGTSFSPEFVFLMPPGNILSPDPAHDAVIYMPEKLLQEASYLNSAFNQLLGIGRRHDPVSIQNTMNLLERQMSAYGVQLKTAQYDQVSAKILNDELQEIQMLTSLFPALFLIVAVLVLNVMICRLVAQQRMVIGTLKALGYANRSLLLHFLCYGLVIGLLGSLLGVGFGYVLEKMTLIKYSTFFRLPMVESLDRRHLAR